MISILKYQYTLSLILLKTNHSELIKQLFLRLDQ
jgi:hypothetical protein